MSNAQHRDTAALHELYSCQSCFDVNSFLKKKKPSLIFTRVVSSAQDLCLGREIDLFLNLYL